MEKLTVQDYLKKGKFNFSDQKVRTAYALNLCTVSVSQIIDYDDLVILEQEYETILNNLNIEKMPKDEALLKILKQLLDTITFFRIQEGDKQFIDREYQNKMKDAIWNAVPNMGLIVAGGNPVTLAISLASQVGIGYMNYRKTKAESAFAYEKQLWKLQRAAIEQFNGLRRELFDTAWRLVDAHELPDEYRLTERQVKQYNQILMDPDALRRYERLDTIKDAFLAYPPFWYFFGNTANELMRLTAEDEAAYYKTAAKSYYEFFIQSFKACNLLRENEVASACALEYIDLLSITEDEERTKIQDLLSFAIQMSGNANDVLQLCAFAYLKLGDAENAARIFRQLVNENYNPIINAQLLSSYYVSAFLAGEKYAKEAYYHLSERIDGAYLYPFPEQKLLGSGDYHALKSIQEEFIHNQKEILIKKCGLIINMLQEKYRVLFYRCIPVPDGKEYTDQYFNNSSASYAARKADGMLLRNKKNLAKYIELLQDIDYPYNYLNVLNDLVNAVYLLDCIHGSENAVLSTISSAILGKRDVLLKFKEKIEDGNKFSVDTYNEMLEFSFDELTKDFFDFLAKCSGEYVAQRSDIVSMNDAEMNLRDFCIQEGFDSPSEIFDKADDIIETAEIKRPFLGIELIEEGVLTSVVNDRFDEVRKIILQYKMKLCASAGVARLYMNGHEGFDRYFINLNIPNKREIRRKTIAVLDDSSEKDNDLLFTTDGIMQVIKGKMKTVVPYDGIDLNAEKTAIILHQPYNNSQVDMHQLIELIMRLRTKPFVEVKDKKTPFDLIAGLIKK